MVTSSSGPHYDEVKAAGVLLFPVLGILPLHVACSKRASDGVLCALLEAYPDGKAAYLGQGVEGYDLWNVFLFVEGACVV